MFYQIIDAASPTKEAEQIFSSDSSDSEEESRPLASLLPLGTRQTDTFSTHGNFSDFSDVEAEDLGSLLSKTISSVDNAANVSHLLILSRDCKQKQTLFTVLTLALLYCISRIRLVDCSLINKTNFIYCFNTRATLLYFSASPR